MGRWGWMMCMVFMVCLPSEAEIYTYRDASGHLFFTDSPGSHEIDSMGARPLNRGEEMPSYTLPSSSMYDPMIVKAAQHYDIPFALIKAVIHVESGFHPRALSPKGAKGLMQLMPLNLAFYKIKNPFDPQENIMGGAAYLHSMLTRFKGDIKLALAAYNAGPGKVIYHHGIPPIAETMAYVVKVERFHRYYRSTLGYRSSAAL